MTRLHHREAGIAYILARDSTCFTSSVYQQMMQDQRAASWLAKHGRSQSDGVAQPFSDLDILAMLVSAGFASKPVDGSCSPHSSNLGTQVLLG